MVADPDKVRELRERGFTVVPGALTAPVAAELRRELERCIQEDLARWAGRPYADAWMVHNPMVRGAAFARVLEHPLMHAYLTELLTATCILYAYTTSSMPPGGSNYSHRVHNDCPRFIPGYVTNVGIILPLDDFTQGNGAPYFLAGSHLLENPPAEADFLARAERVTPKCGDMVVFNARTFHMGGQNRTERARHALTLNVCRSYMRQRFDYPRLVPADVVASLGEVGRRFLGFDVRMPTSLDEYYVPPEQRLYKANQG
jgi:ectoine hydroxylase-related dioxygenase (phytanoyl-CoA dioxygenase family)